MKKNLVDVISELSNEQRETMVARASKKKRSYMLIGVICFILGALILFIGITVFQQASVVCFIISFILINVGSVFDGMACYCINNIRAVLSKGKVQGGGLVWLIFFVLGGVIMPIIVVTITRNSLKLTNKCLDWNI